MRGRRPPPGPAPEWPPKRHPDPELEQLLAFLLQIDPHIRPTFNAPAGWRGRPIEPTPPHLQRVMPRQRKGPPRGLCAPFHHRRARP